MQIINPLQIPYSYKLGTDGYIRPKKTYTDTIQNEKDIMEKLQGFVEIEPDDVDNIPVGSFLRYIKYDKKEKKEKFVLGGRLVNIETNYLVLSGINNGLFSVQRYSRDGEGNNGRIIYKTRFFKRLTEEEKLKDQLADTSKKATNMLEKYKELIEDLQKQIIELKQENAILKKRLGR